jgi:hypothetical protein
MTRKEAQSMSQDKIFLHMEALLAKALEETEKKYGKDMATIIHGIINGVLGSFINHALELPCPPHVAFCAWLETIARWNEQIDELVRK